MMTTREKTVRFLIPAFLGDANQDGRWRTPPFKALLRQWWRVAWSESNDYSQNIDRLRRDEGDLFGAAADSTGNRSLVRLRLDRWDGGILKKNQWLTTTKAPHPEVKFPIDSALYMGYGPVVLPKGKKEATLKANAAIQAGESACLRIAFPTNQAQLLDRALTLMNAFASLGGRSRNGWGSFVFEKNGGRDVPAVRDWRQCLDRDWPHAIGSDEEGTLIWRTDAFENWPSLMRQLAEIKIGLRTQFKFQSQSNALKPEDRHWLSHPVTHHNVKPWRQGRLPNSLRFKVRTDEEGGLHGVIFHVPCLPPPQFQPDTNSIQRVWRQVHAYLDNQSDLRRIDK